MRNQVEADQRNFAAAGPHHEVHDEHQFCESWCGMCQSYRGISYFAAPAAIVFAAVHYVSKIAAAYLSSKSNS